VVPVRRTDDGARLTYALVAAWCFVVAVAGGAVGLVLGNIRLPVLLLAASSPAAGAGANIGVSGVSALTAAVVHFRAGRIDWRVFGWLTPPSVAGAIVGGYVSGVLPGDMLLAVIGAVLLAMAADLLRPRSSPSARSAGGALEARGTLVALGALIGFVGGVVGLILGSLRLPALLRLGEPAARAVGTNMATGFFVGWAGVVGHTAGGVDWTLLAVGAAASVPGAILGARLTGRMPEQQLRHAIAAVLVVAGAAALVQAFA
jgi:hypothetical protein